MVLSTAMLVRWYWLLVSLQLCLDGVRKLLVSLRYLPIFMIALINVVVGGLFVLGMSISAMYTLRSWQAPLLRGWSERLHQKSLQVVSRLGATSSQGRCVKN